MGGGETNRSKHAAVHRPTTNTKSKGDADKHERNTLPCLLLSCNPKPIKQGSMQSPKREREKKREASQIKPRCPHHGATKGRHLAACHRPPPSAWRRGRAWPSPCEGGRPSGRKHRCVTVGRHATVLTGLVGLLLPVSILITRPTYAQPPDYDTV